MVDRDSEISGDSNYQTVVCHKHRKCFQKIINNTGTRQCTQAVWSTLQYISVYLCMVM